MHLESHGQNLLVNYESLLSDSNFGTEPVWCRDARVYFVTARITRHAICRSPGAITPKAASILYISSKDFGCAALSESTGDIVHTRDVRARQCFLSVTTRSLFEYFPDAFYFAVTAVPEEEKNVSNS